MSVSESAEGCRAASPMCYRARTGTSFLHPLTLVKRLFYSLRQRREQERKETYDSTSVSAFSIHANIKQTSKQTNNIKKVSLGIGIRIAIIHTVNLSFTGNKE